MFPFFISQITFVTDSNTTSKYLGLTFSKYSPSMIKVKMQVFFFDCTNACVCVCEREKVCYLRFRDTMSRQLHNCKIAFSQRALNIIKSHTYRSPLRRLLVLGGHDHSFLVNYWMKRCVDDLATFTCSYKAIQVAGMILFLILKLKRKWGILVPRAPAHVFVSR